METTITEKHSSSHVLETPIWMTVLRGFQLLLSIVIMALAARLLQDINLDEFGLAVATSILTWAVLFYIFTTEKITPWQVAYHVVAVVALDGFLVIMWLATFAAAAARRASLIITTYSSVPANYGSYGKRQLEKRDYSLRRDASMFSAVAGLGALVWLLFIATFVYTLIMFLRGRKEGRFPIGNASSTGNTFQMAPKTEQTTSMMQQQEQQQPQPQPQPQPQQPFQPQQTGEHQPTLSQSSPQNSFQPAQSPYHEQPQYQLPQDQQAYNIQHPQQYQQNSIYHQQQQQQQQ